MSIEFFVVLITSITSLLIAIISLLNSRMDNKAISNSNQSLELLKFNIENKKNKLLFSENQFNKYIESLDLILKEVQKLKDNLLIILNNPQCELDSKTAIQMINKNRQEMFTAYESVYLNLKDEEKKVAHDIKSLFFNIENDLKKILPKNDSFILEDNEKQLFIDYRNTLTNKQNLLRNIKYCELSKYL